MSPSMFPAVSFWSGFRSLASVKCKYRSLPELLLLTLMLTCIMGILQVWITRLGPLTDLNTSQMIWILRWANSKPWIWAWVVVELVSPLAVPHPYHVIEATTLTKATQCQHWQEAFGRLTLIHQSQPHYSSRSMHKAHSPQHCSQRVGIWASSPSLIPSGLAYSCF